MDATEHLFTLKGFVHSQRRLRKTANGGGYRFSVDVDESQIEAWTKLCAVSEQMEVEIQGRLTGEVTPE